MTILPICRTAGVLTVTGKRNRRHNNVNEQANSKPLHRRV